MFKKYEYVKSFQEGGKLVIQLAVDPLSLQLKILKENYPTWFNNQLKEQALSDAYDAALVKVLSGEGD